MSGEGVCLGVGGLGGFPLFFCLFFDICVQLGAGQQLL